MGSITKWKGEKKESVKWKIEQREKPNLRKKIDKLNEQVLKDLWAFNKGANLCHQSPRRRGERGGAEKNH